MTFEEQDGIVCGSGAAFELPAWLEENRLEDDLLAAAYENLPDRFRAALKTALAQIHFIYASPPRLRKSEERDKHAGLWRKSQSRPALWAMIAFNCDYVASGRLCSAAAIAALADVRNIFAVSVGGRPDPVLLPGLELCGIQDVFCLDLPSAGKLILDLFEASGRRSSLGRIVALHAGELAMLGDLARKMSIACYEEFRKPNLLAQNPESFAMDIIRFAHGFEPPVENSASLDAIYTDSTSMADQDAPLLITPGLEAFWLNRGLRPEFFNIDQNMFGLIGDTDDPFS